MQDPTGDHANDGIGKYLRTHDRLIVRNVAMSTFPT
jgi:hypothetical protein